jgi:hypothetical protein
MALLLGTTEREDSADGNPSLTCYLLGRNPDYRQINMGRRLARNTSSTALPSTTSSTGLNP